MLKTIIVDDEEDARIILRSHLETFCSDVEVVAEASSVKKGIAAIEEHKPDLVFLDIRLSPGSGFDVLDALSKINFAVVFVTAYDEYAIKAIRFSALDYLLKPIDIDELCEAVKRVTSNEAHPSRDLQLEIFKENVRTQFGRIILPTLEGFIVVELRDIVRCEADRNYTHFLLDSGRKITVSRSLKSYEDLMQDNGFCRVHQSHLINIARVKEYKRRKKGGIAILDNGEEIPVSDSRKDDFLGKF